jgi:hypothetical protein
MIAHDPLQGSGQAALPHPALALGQDARAVERIGMTDGRQRQPAGEEHDSGPMWVAKPLSYDFCIHYTSPV